MIRAIIFDIDGVVLDSERLHGETESETAKAFGIDISPDEVIRLYSGVHIKDELADMAKRANKEMPMQEALAIKDKLLRDKLAEGIPLIPHVKEILSTLANDYGLAFATSGARFFIEEALKKSGVLDYFNVRVYSDQVSIPKPDPAIFLEAAKRLGVKAEETVVVEDSESGFKAAKAANMLLIAKKGDHNQQKDFSLADYIIEDLKEIPKILENIS